MTGPLRTVSLRRRVTALSLTVLAAVLLVVGVLTDVVFSAQIRSELRQQLNVRATLAGQLVAQGVPADEVARRVEAPGIRAELVAADGRVYAGDPDDDERWMPPPWRGGPPDRDHRGWWDDDGGDDGDWGNPQVLEQPLADGSRLTLVASGGPVSGAQTLLRRTLIVLSLAALAVAGIVMLLTTRVALAPLDAMTAVARSITGGDRGRRLAPARTDTELGRTAAAFDAMLDELEGAEAAARASEARTRRFVADAAHELRTPIAGVQAVAEAALAPDMAPEDRERLHLLMLRESRRAGRLVDDLLVLARLDAGLELRREPVDLLELARTEAERAQLVAPDQRVEVRGEPVTVTGDASRLAQVLGNLLDNARRHAGPGVVTVTVSGGDRATLLVTDDGPGVAPADRERIFDRLVRLDEARGEDGGAGLGLAIARGIARVHGGDLRCVDPPSDRGAAFELVLPTPRRAA
ncbi:signal transduction histidine kinase [Pseudonocardia hierapolitana]|uniref:histidine kinase n=1 Tax=Pseudonocardia hierapolitana TaxID=1128676 RepID=A0A561SN57_9PSEU|nr:HAMP domain-containing sensor histidine kinase [Pseudonocardia hierapolitana]TWF76276.1 signal transduction histidine kinase [Pseudonocardia hierapolitana]